MRKLFVIFFFLFTPTPLFAQEAAQEPAALSAPQEEGDAVPGPAAEGEPAVVSHETKEDGAVALSPDEEDDTPSASAVIEKLNEVMKKIYDEAVAAKAKFREMASFDETALTKNEYGIYKIEYAMPIPEGAKNVWPFAFGVTIDKPKDKTFTEQAGYFNYPLPYLEHQISAYAVKHPLRRQFDVAALIDKLGTELVDYQQQFLPLQVYLVMEKDEYKVHEMIHFKLVLANVSKHNILVKELGEKSLFFSINDTYWGTKAGDVQETKPLSRFEARRMQQKARIEALRARRGRQKVTPTSRERKTRVGDQLILRSQEALTIDFTGDGYKRPQDVKIRVVYQLNFRGIKPTATATLKIVE